MVLGVIRLKLRMTSVHSLKEKRSLVKSLIARIRNRFDVAVSEVDMHDSWHNAEIGVCAVGNSEPVINSLLDKVLDFVEQTCEADMIEPEFEIIHLG